MKIAKKQWDNDSVFSLKDMHTWYSPNNPKFLYILPIETLINLLCILGSKSCHVSHLCFIFKSCCFILKYFQTHHLIFTFAENSEEAFAVFPDCYEMN